jgi:galactokinase
MDIEYVRSRFIKHFDGTTGSVYASPGRINLIGEHTDYNGGFVFPGAVDKGMIAEIKPNGTDKVRAYSIDLKDYVEFGLNEEDAPKASWAIKMFDEATSYVFYIHDINSLKLILYVFIIILQECLCLRSCILPNHRTTDKQAKR